MNIANTLTRRGLMKSIALGTAGLMAGCTSNVSAEVQTPKPKTQPNIVLFLVDDMGWQDTSVPFWTKKTPFNKRFRTPNMERLAASGVKFTQAYACAVCSPTRVSLMTGLNAARHRVTNWTLRKNRSQDARHATLAFPKWNMNGLQPVGGIGSSVHANALPKQLSAAGYRTIHVGKAHFGAQDTPGEDPCKVGFDVNIAGHAAGGPGSYLGTENFGNKKGQHTKPWGVPGLEKYHGKDIFLSEAMTIDANAAVDQAVKDKKPFFLYMAHYAIHVPFKPDKRFYKRYADAGLGRTEAMYAALIEGMDKSLGDILKNVKRHGLTDDTIVIFMSDNGGLSAGGRGGKRHTHNKPLSSGKGSIHEGGIRVPMIVTMPGVTKPKTVCNDYVIIEDFFPTILEMAGVTPAQVGGVIDGVSFMPLLTGKTTGYKKDRPLFWHYPNKWGPTGPGIGSYSAVRQGDWKLVYYHDTGKYELFNIPADIGEAKNLVAAKPEIRKKLATVLREFLISAKAQMSTVKKTGKVVPMPK